MNSDSLHADRFGHARDIDGDDVLVVPPGAHFDGQGDADRGTHAAEDDFELAEVAQQTGASALDDFFRGAAQVDVHDIEAQGFDRGSGSSQSSGIGAEELRGDGVLAGLEI
jgi:hypothetical protein